MDDDQLRRAMLGGEDEAAAVTRRARDDDDSREASAQRARESVAPHDLDKDADPTDDEIIGRPRQVGRLARGWIFGISIAFVTVLLAMTLYLIVDSGPDWLEIISLLLLSLAIYGLVNAATYEGKDPLEPLREIDAEAARRDRERREARQRSREERAGRKSESHLERGDSERSGGNGNDTNAEAEAEPDC